MLGRAGLMRSSWMSGFHGRRGSGSNEYCRVDCLLKRASFEGENLAAQRPAFHAFTACYESSADPQSAALDARLESNENVLVRLEVDLDAQATAASRSWC